MPTNFIFDELLELEIFAHWPFPEGDRPRLQALLTKGRTARRRNPGIRAVARQKPSDGEWPQESPVVGLSGRRLRRTGCTRRPPTPKAHLSLDFLFAHKD